MSQPTITDVHLDAVLTNISVAYIQNTDNFVAGKVFPDVPVEKQTDKYYTYTKADWFRDEAQLRADSTESEGSGYGLSTAAYSCDVYAFHKDIGEKVRKNADAGINLDRDATEFVTQRLLLRKEIQWVTEFFTTSVWGTDVTPSNLWSDFSASDPIEDIELGKETILKNTGFMPNTLVLGYQVWRKLKNHPDFIDRVKYTSAANMSPEIIARMLEVDRVIISKGIKNTANEGGTASYGFTHGKHALLAYVAPSPGLLTPSAGYTFSWAGVSAGMGSNVGISRMEMPLKKSVRVEGEIAWDNKVVGADLGYFFNGAVV